MLSDGGLPLDSVIQSEEPILADSQRVIDKFNQRHDGAMLQIALAPCSPFSVSQELMRETALLANKMMSCCTHTLLKPKMKMIFVSASLGCDHSTILGIVDGLTIELG